MSAQSIKDALLRQLLVIPPKEDHELAQFVAKEVLGKEGAKEAVLEMVEGGYPLEAAWRLVAGGTVVAFNEKEGTFDLWRERVMQGLLYPFLPYPSHPQTTRLQRPQDRL